LEIHEFLDTYSDDVIYLLEGRSALLTHPLRAELKELLDASTCRLLAVFMIGSIEMMLTQWRDRDHHDILDVYFEGRHQNGERVAALCAAFQRAGITVDTQVFNDYLAIKYLRNTIVHGAWKEHQKQWVLERGFPTDTRKLTKEHLDRMLHVNQNMMFYIVLTSLPTPGASKPDKLVRLDETVTRQRDETGILRPHDLDRIIWNNLERIQALIYEDIERAATSETYNWTAGLSRTEIEAMSDQERKRRFYLAARSAGENDYEPLAQHRVLATEALTFWQEYWQRAVLSRGLQDEQIDQSLDVLRSPSFAKLAADGPWCLTIAGVPDDDEHRLLDQVLGDDASFTGEQVARALRIGRLAWELIPNIMPVALLTVTLPIADPPNTAAYLREAHRALSAFRLNCVWYSWVEQKRPPIEDGLTFYDLMSAELMKRPPTHPQT
jgi:hypothetical protein